MPMGRENFLCCFLFLLLAVLSSFTVFSAEESSRSEERSSQETSVSDDSSSSQEDDNAKDKRSREEIMFGNQQNKAAGLVDDIMGMAQRIADKSADNGSPQNIEKKSNTTEDNEKSEEIKVDDKNEKRTIQSYEDTDPNEISTMMGSAPQNWYHAVPVPNNALQYLVNAPLQNLPSEEFSNSLYDQEDLYRRKRQLLGRPLPLRKRSLRSSLGQMIQKRGIRLPRRSMRLKRQTEVEDLLSLLGNLEPADRNRFYEEQLQVLPERFSTGYPETPAPEFRYPYHFLQQGNDLEDNNADTLDEGAADIDSLMLLPPNSRYVETSDSGLFPYRTQEEENEGMREWLARHTTPSVFPVARRSSSVFYPYDYRYVPGLKKRSRIMNNNGLGNRLSVDDEQDSDFGKWGQVVQVPEAYASGEDVARLYALANLMAEGEDSEGKMRRSA